MKTGFRKLLAITFLSFTIFIQNSKAQTWTVVGPGASAVVYAMATYSGDLVIGGDNGGANGYIYQWNGTVWSTLSTKITLNSGSDPFIFSMVVYNGNLYAAGQFDNANGTAVNNIAEWNGGWSTLASGGLAGTSAGTTDNVVNAMIVYNGKLIVAGDFLKAGNTSVQHIAQWDGTTWTAMGTGLGSGATDCVSALAIYNGNLYAGGQFATDGLGGTTLNNIAEWVGGSWVALPGLVGTTGVTLNNGGIGASSGTKPIVYALTNVDGAGGGLFVGGDFKKAGNITVSNIAEWNGSTWATLGTGMTVNNGDGADVYALYAYNGNVYAVGDFKKAGGVPVSYVADWNSSWNAMSTGFNSDAHSLWVWNGTLFAGGVFNLTGTNFYIAQWGGALPITLVSFDAQYNGDEHTVDLNWVTATETNNKFFTVEKSTDGLNWENVINIDGAGNSSQVISYKTEDKNPYPGVSYYRLKQTDYDGNFSYSEIKSIDISAPLNTLSIVPNPVKKLASVTYNFAEAVNSQLNIYDCTGRLMNTIPINAAKGVNSTLLDVSGYANGIYIVTISNSNTQFTTRFVVSH